VSIIVKLFSAMPISLLSRSFTRLNPHGPDKPGCGLVLRVSI
jgi:hypothetical protein